MRRWLFAVVLLIASGRPVRAQAPEVQPLEGLLDAALAGNPGLAASREAWRAEEARVGPAGALPKLEAELKSETGGALREWQLMQPLPFPGKLGLERRMQRRMAEAAYERHREAAIDVLTRVKVAYWELFRVEATIAAFERELEAQQAAKRAVESRVASGRAEAGDALLAEAELERLDNMLFEERQARVLTVVRLNALLGRAPSTPLGAAAAPELRELPAQASELEKRSLERSPAVRAADREAQRDRSAASRARREYLPDLAAGFERRTPESQPAEEMLMLRLELPVWLSGPRGASRAAEAARSSSERSLEAARLAASAVVRSEAVEAETHLRLARSSRDKLLPLSSSALAAQSRAYESGRGDVLKLLEAARRHFENEREYVDQLYHFGEHLALLEQGVGEEFSQPRRFPAPGGEER